MYFLVEGFQEYAAATVAGARPRLRAPGEALPTFRQPAFLRYRGADFPYLWDSRPCVRKDSYCRPDSLPVETKKSWPWPDQSIDAIMNKHYHPWHRIEHRSFVFRSHPTLKNRSRGSAMRSNLSGWSWKRQRRAGYPGAVGRLRRARAPPPGRGLGPRLWWTLRMGQCTTKTSPVAAGEPVGNGFGIPLRGRVSLHEGAVGAE